MILRRIIAHFRKQEWTAVAIDFVIVVLGVFVGIQASNWNAARIERSGDRRALALFIDELSLMSEEAEYDLARVMEAGQALSKAGAIARNCAADEAERMALAGAIAATLEWRVPDVRPAGLSAIGNSGTLSRLGDPDLTRAVGSINQTIKMFDDAMYYLAPRHDRAWGMLAPYLRVGAPLAIEAPLGDGAPSPRKLALAPQESLCAGEDFQLGLMLLTDFYASSLYNFTTFAQNLTAARALALEAAK